MVRSADAMADAFIGTSLLRVVTSLSMNGEGASEGGKLLTGVNSFTLLRPQCVSRPERVN
jgi:hypothetical protein